MLDATKGFRKALGFLQNAYSSAYAGRRWPRERWLKALRRSRSGLRLATLEKDTHPAVEWWFDNTTAAVAATPAGREPVDLEHMRRVLEAQAPDVLVCFGAQAARALWKLDTAAPALLLPHPAFRLLTTALYREAARLLLEGFAGRLRLTQGRGKVVATPAVGPKPPRIPRAPKVPIPYAFTMTVARRKNGVVESDSFVYGYGPTRQAVILHPYSRQYRLLDSDGNTCAVGHFLDRTEGRVLTGREPLLDFGSPRLGAVGIEYCKAGVWTPI
jgi:hypothetical protein